MHEVIHLSLSSTANHLQTHFYNAQETYFVFDDESAKASKVDPQVLFRQGKGFTPRALIWEMRGGYGAMKGFSGVYNESIDENAIPWSGNLEKIDKPVIKKSEYQAALDNGLAPPQLTTSNTKYWSDYLNMFYHPNSLLTLADWEYHPVDNPQGLARGGTHKFLDHTVGADQWDEINNNHNKEYLEETFRPILELCDQVSGLSLTTEIDSGWGGFTSELLANLRDDHVPKIPIITWGLHQSGKLTRQQELSRIRSTNAMIQNSSLYIPMQPPTLPINFDRNIDFNSQWHLGALYNTVYESFSLLSSLRDGNRISMQQLIDDLEMGTNRNIAMQVRSGLSDKGLFDFSLVQSNHIFSKTALKRPALQKSETINKPKSIADYLNPLTIVDPWESYFQKQKLMDDGTAENALTRYILDQPYALPHSHPGFIKPEDELYAELAIGDGAKEWLRGMSNFVSRINIEDRDELKENFNCAADEYTFGWEDDSESEDD